MYEKPFSQDAIVAEVLDTWPQVIPVFLKHKTACVGCVMARFETLADVSRNYGIPTEELIHELMKSLEVSEHDYLR